MLRSYVPCATAGLSLLVLSQLFAIEPIPRILPPAGIELPAEDRQRISQRLREVLGRAQAYLEHDSVADVAVCIKAVDYALRHGEFYQARDVPKALRILQLADERLGQLAANATPWSRQSGRVVRGFRSNVDGSYQPYGLVIPADFDFDRPAPLYVWLHGRGDKQTDLHFIHDRLDQDGQIKPAGAIVLHPFGRQCLGFKSAGETDVLESIAHVQSQYRIDPDRIVLMGFSMGGAGAWHLGAHYTDRFVAISPGAGFAETARYTNLKPADFPPRYEQLLWGVYDVPAYSRNLLNRPVIAYSGELDKQIQAARVMEEAFREHGRELTHLIGPGMGHKYHPETLQEIMRRMSTAVEQGRPRLPTRVSLQTRTLRYNRMDWVEALELEEHWRDARIDAEIVGDRKLKLTTSNIGACRLSPWQSMAGSEIEIDGTKLTAPTDTGAAVTLVRRKQWSVAAGSAELPGLRKQHGLQGPIDDAFLESFLVVVPSGQEQSELLREWFDFESNHFRDRWRGVFRGELRLKSDQDVTPDDIKNHHLVVWGTPETNQILMRALSIPSGSLPVHWSADEIVVGSDRFASKNHIPVFIYPNPLNPARYLVVNSGPTFREAHDRTNSLQNPKLPDWAIIDVTQPPDARSPGRVVAADFFDERWRLKN
jgi:predicted esterase